MKCKIVRKKEHERGEGHSSVGECVPSIYKVLGIELGSKKFFKQLNQTPPPPPPKKNWCELQIGLQEVPTLCLEKFEDQM